MHERITALFRIMTDMVLDYAVKIEEEKRKTPKDESCIAYLTARMDAARALQDLFLRLLLDDPPPQ